MTTVDSLVTRDPLSQRHVQTEWLWASTQHRVESREALSVVRQQHLRESYHRAVAAGVAADLPMVSATLEDQRLSAQDLAHPLVRAFPFLRESLEELGKRWDAVVAVSDTRGNILLMDGEPSALAESRNIGLVEGSNWHETAVGTNGIGTSLALQQPIFVLNGEHYLNCLKDWNSLAVPIWHRSSPDAVAVIAMIASGEVAVPQAFSMLHATAAILELAMTHDQAPSSATAATCAVHLRCLGEAGGAKVEIVQDSERRSIQLSQRHSEILVLIASAPKGLTGDELQILLYEDGNGESTLRAEIKRLRGLIGEDVIAARPYRIHADFDADWLVLEGHIRQGAIRQAMDLYAGPLLPGSVAPGVARLRRRVEDSLREGILASRDPELMADWTRTDAGADDYAVLTAQHDLLAPSSPMRGLLVEKLSRLDRELV